MPQYTAEAEATKRLNETLSSQIERLTSTIRAASESSERLAKALNRLTLWGTIVAALGVAVAATSVCRHWG
jgi:hypothetical protein